MGEHAAEVRATLGEYSESFLAYLRSVSSGTVFVAYSIWAFEKAQEAHLDVPWYQLSIVPFVLGVLALRAARRSGPGLGA